MEQEPNAFATAPQSGLPAPYDSRRHDGWTIARQTAFLEALAACGCVHDACRAVGMSRESAYELKARPSAIAFRLAWEAALDCGVARVDDGAVERTIKGVARPVFYKGEQVGEWRHHDERLTMFLLRYRRPHRYGGHLDRLLPPLLDVPECDMDEPDPDEAIGRLEYHLGDLTDFGDPPGPMPCANAETSRANDGVSFVNFGLRRRDNPASPQAPVEAPNDRRGSPESDSSLVPRP